MLRGTHVLHLKATVPHQGTVSRVISTTRKSS